MATRTRKLEIEIGSEAKGVGKGFDKAAKEGDKLADKLKKSGEEAGTKLRTGVGEEVDKLGSKLRTAGAKAGEKFSGGMESGLGGLGDAVSGGFDIGSITDTLTGSISGLAGSLGPVAGAAGAAIGGALAVGLMESIDIERSNDRVSAQLALTAVEAERFGRISGELYADAYGESVQEVDAALGAVLSSLGDISTFTDAELSKAGALALDFAAIWEVDVTEAIGDVGILVNTGLARDFEEAFDLMTVAMRETPAAFRDELIPAIEEYSGFLAGLGFTGEEAFAIMTRSAEDFGTFGIDKSMDALKEFQIRATDMSTLSVEAFDTLGLDAETMAGRILAGGDTARGAFDEIVAGLLSIEDPSLRANTAIALFGTPIEDLSVSDIPEFLANLANLEDGLGDVAGAATDSGNTLNDNLGTRIEELKRGALQGLVTLIDERVIPGFEKLSDIFDTRVKPALDAVAPPFQAFFGFLADHPIILQVALAIGAIAVGLALLFNPLTIAAALFGGLILIVKFFWGVLEAGWQWVQEHWPGLATFLQNPIAAASAFIANKFTDIKTFAGNAKDFIVRKFNDLVGFVSGLPGRIGSAASGMWDGIKDSFRSAINTIIRWWNRLAFPRFDIPTVDPLGSFGPSIGGGHIGGWQLPNITPLAGGGIARASPGGSIVRVAEGRHDEAIVPLDGHRIGGDTYVFNIDLGRSIITSESDAEELVTRALNAALRHGAVVENRQGERL